MVRRWTDTLIVGAEPLGCGASQSASAINSAVMTMALTLACVAVCFIGDVIVRE